MGDDAPGSGYLATQPLSTAGCATLGPPGANLQPLVPGATEQAFLADGSARYTVQGRPRYTLNRPSMK